MPLTTEDVRDAFNATALEQDGGEFRWDRVADRLNRKIADRRYQRAAAFLLGEQPR